MSITTLLQALTGAVNADGTSRFIENQWTEPDYGGYYQPMQAGTRHVGGINDPLAGYTTKQRARAQGQWLGANPGDASFHKGLQQHWGELAITWRYENNSCLRILNEGNGMFRLAKTLGSAANQTQWRQEV